MHPDPSESIEHLIRPLEHNAEIHLAARCYLLDQMEKTGGVEDKVAAFVKTRENGMPQRGASPRAVTSAATQAPGAHPKPWRGWFYLAVVALVVTLAAPFLWQAYETWGVASRFANLTSWKPFEDSYHPLRIRRLPERERILLLGDESRGSYDAETWRPLWKLDPNQPAFLAQYALTYQSDGRALSPEILEAAGRVDPDNGLYPLLQASTDWRTYMTEKKPTIAEKKAGKILEWTINDETTFLSQIALIHRAAGMPHIRGYLSELHQSQIPCLGKTEDWPGYIEKITYLSHQYIGFKIHSLWRLCAARAQYCADHSDPEGFHSIIADWKAICRTYSHDETRLGDGLVLRSVLSSPLPHFRDAARKLHLDDEARRYDELDQWFKQAREDRRTASKKTDPVDDLLTQKGSLIMAAFWGPSRNAVKTPPPITAEDLRPGRYTEHAWLGRAFAVAASLIFLLLAGAAALCRFRQSALVRELSPCMAGLLRVSDCLWIAGLGVLLPTAWFLTIQFLTPMGAREWSLRHTLMIGPCAQFGAAVLLVAVTALVTAGWRLGTRGAAFGLRGERPWIGWTMVGILALVIPAVGAFPGWPPTQSEEGMRIALGVCFTIPVLWLGISLLTNLVNRSESSLRRATHARLMIPTWMFAAVVFAALVPVYHHSEKHWFQKDRLMGLADPAVEFSRYEMEVAKTLNRKLRELMDKHL